MSDFPSLAGRLLIAMPGIGDPRFEQAVILLCAHAADHAMGLRLDQRAPGVDLRDVMTKLKTPGAETAPPASVLLGGPVDTERGFVLHTPDWSAPEATLEVAGGLALTATREALTAMIDPAVKPEKAVLVLGYAGWDAGQVEEELADNVWLIGHPDPSVIFDEDHESKWTRALASVGVEAANLSTQIGRA